MDISQAQTKSCCAGIPADTKAKINAIFPEIVLPTLGCCAATVWQGIPDTPLVVKYHLARLCMPTKMAFA